MDNDNDVGKKAALPVEHFSGERANGRLLQQQMGDERPLIARRIRPHVTAMSQQSSDSGRGTESLPQKLVQLVGYRDPGACRESWVRPRQRVQQ